LPYSRIGYRFLRETDGCISGAQLHDDQHSLFFQTEEHTDHRHILCCIGVRYSRGSRCLAVKATASAWFLLCTSLGALWLAAEKRRQELKLADSGSGSHRKVLADYSVSIVTRMENIIAPSLLTSYAMYSFNSPHGHWMMITVPIVLYGMMRYQMLSEQGTSTGAPEDVFWKDRPIQLTIALWLLACAFVIYGSPTQQMAYYGRLIDSLKFW